MIYIGLDPGKRGGLAALAEDGEPLLACPMPVIPGKKAEFDLPRIFEKLLRQGQAKVTIERLAPMPVHMGGGATNFQRGYSMGMLQAFCTALKLPWELVSPSVWQKAFWKGKADTKQRAIMIVGRMFPDVDLYPTVHSRKAHDGIADAVLIAEWNRRHSNGLLT